jgi:hypothetical protein
MADVDGYSIQLITTLLDGSATAMSSPGTAQTGTVLEATGGLPHKIPGGTSDLNIKLGTLTDVKWLAIWADGEGVTFRVSNGGDALDANPFAFLANVEDGMGISEIWVSNTDTAERKVTVLAAE